MKHQPIHLFSFGYFGWGNHTKQLVKAVDEVEKARGFDAPFFVDVRVRRTVRAKGFLGSAFEKQLGAKRHQWIPDLGNQNIVDGGNGIKIRNPEASKELLDIARRCAEKGRRVIFFCSCDNPHGCHRMSVARLVVRRAAKEGIAVSVDEWPGIETVSKTIEMKVKAGDIESLEKGKKFLPIGKSLPLKISASLPWGAVIRVTEGGTRPNKEVFIVTGPSRFRVGDGWALRVFEFGDSASSLRMQSKEIREERQYFDL